MRATSNKKPPSELLTVGQAAARLNVHPNTVRRWARRGMLNEYRVGPRGDRRFHRSDVEGLLVSGWRGGIYRPIPPASAEVAAHG